MDIDAIEVDFGDGRVGILRAGIDIKDGETQLDGFGAWLGAFFAFPADLSHVEGLLGVDVVEMQGREWVPIDADTQILYARIGFPGLARAYVPVTYYYRGDARVVGRELVFYPFADAVTFLAFHPCGFVGKVGGIVGRVGELALWSQRRRTRLRMPSEPFHSGHFGR